MSKKKRHPIPEELQEPIIVTDVLDLHGFYPQQIEEVVTAFIENAVSLDLKEVRIIHGKGKSRLKWEVHQVLEELETVSRYGDAETWGATLVQLILSDSASG